MENGVCWRVEWRPRMVCVGGMVVGVVTQHLAITGNLSRIFGEATIRGFLKFLTTYSMSTTEERKYV